MASAEQQYRPVLSDMLDALIVDSNPLSRGFLWQATLAESHFRRVKAVSTLEAALGQLLDNVYHVLLVPSTIPIDRIREFVAEARQTPGGKEAAFIVVLKVPDQTTEKIATGIMDGTDGFLFEPYSVQSLNQVAAVASRIKGEHDRKRKIAAIKLLITDLMKQLDHYAAVVQADHSTAHHSKEKKELVKSAATLKRFKDMDLSLYHEIAPEMFASAQPRVEIYKGASRRLKKKLNH